MENVTVTKGEYSITTDKSKMIYADYYTDGKIIEPNNVSDTFDFCLTDLRNKFSSTSIYTFFRGWFYFPFYCRW